jgi:hypothetical protein
MASAHLVEIIRIPTVNGIQLGQVIIFPIGRLEVNHPRHAPIVLKHVSPVVICELEFVADFKLPKIVF